MALAQGSGELIWWPWLIAKYGLALLFLLIPACLLQFPLNYAIGTYTLLTGESIFQGFIRLNRWIAFALWILMTISFLWFGSFATAGGTALAALTRFPHGWTLHHQMLFWGEATILVCCIALAGSRIVYTLIERFMWLVVVATLVGLIVACSHPTVLSQVPAFLHGLIIPQRPWPRPWDPTDATTLLTAIAFAGLGGFWTLFYSYWLREKGVGMAKAMGHVEGLGGRKEVVFEVGAVPWKIAHPHISHWRRFLAVDSAIGILGNLFTTLMTCLLAYAVLYPNHLLPEGDELAAVQSRFFEVAWGPAGRVLFLIVAAAFLNDTWMATADAVARIHTDCVLSFFPAARRWSVRRWYLCWLIAVTIVTAGTLFLDQPGVLIQLSAVIGFLGTVSFAGLLWAVNYRVLPRYVDQRLCPKPWAVVGLAMAGVIYLALAVMYLWTRLAHHVR